MGSAAFAFFPRLLWQQKALPAGIFPKAFVAAKGFWDSGGRNFFFWYNALFQTFKFCFAAIISNLVLAWPR